MVPGICDEALPLQVYAYACVEGGEVGPWGPRAGDLHASMLQAVCVHFLHIMFRRFEDSEQTVKMS